MQGLWNSVSMTLMFGLMHCVAIPAVAKPPATQPAGRFRLGVAGLVHAHVYGFLQNAMNRSDIEIVGMAEAEPELLRRYGKHHHKMADGVLFSDLEQMLEKARPEAVAVFTDTHDHLKV